MDPDQALADILWAAKYLQESPGGQMSDDCEVAYRMADAVTDLHEWLSKGGFRPADWDQQREA